MLFRLLASLKGSLKNKTSDFARSAGAAVVLDVGLGVVGTVAGVVVVEGFDAVFVGGEQVFEHLLHRHATAFEAFGVVAGVGGNGLVDEFLHDANQLQIAVVAAHLPQGFVLVFQTAEFGHRIWLQAF